MVRFKVQVKVMDKWLDGPFGPFETSREAENSLFMFQSLWPLGSYRVIWEPTVPRKRAA